MNRAEQLTAGLPDAIKPGWVYGDDAAGVGQRVVDDVLRRDFPTLRQTVPFRFDENFLSAGGAMPGRPYNRVGARAFNSLQDLRDTLLEEELHQRWFKRGILDDVHSNFELDSRFYQTIERYKARRYWPRTEYQDAWLQRQQQLPK